MSWLEVDWNQGRPNGRTIEWLWRSVVIQPVEGVPSAVADYLSELRRLNVNGGAAYAAFAVSGNAEFDWFAKRNRWDEVSFFSRFLTHATVRSALPDVTKEPRFDERASFEWGSSLSLDGELARKLVMGGAYEKFDRPPREAKQLAIAVCDALFGDRYLDVEVFHCWNAWSDWFCDVAWDHTCIIIDKRKQTVAVVASTDTD
jgi:hypothetical protein